MTNRIAGSEIASSHGAEAPARSVAEPGSSASAGLVDKETSHVLPDRIEVHGPSLKGILRDLSRQRRMQRMRRTVLRFADVARDGMATSQGSVDLIMVTLTYADADGWEPGHVSKFVQRCTEWLERREHSYAYAWVIEMQKRGAPHYHVLFWLPRGVRLPKPDCLNGRQRTVLWPHGMTKIERARSPGYIVKYTSKGTDDLPLPFRARLFGVGASIREWRRVARWGALPRWLRDLSTEGDVFARVASAGWLNRTTGEVHECQWRFGFNRVEGCGWVVWFERKRAVGAAEGEEEDCGA
jgi:hypothetical protein